MRKYYYKGESISILLTTQIPEIGDRRKITDYNIISITVQGIIPFIEIIDNYSIKLHLSSTQTKFLKEGIAPIVVTLSKDNYTTIGKNIDLYIREIDSGKPIDGVGYLENMILAMNVGDLIFNLSLTQISRSNYEIWLDNGHNGTELDYLSWLKKPSIDASETAITAATEAQQKALLADAAATEAQQKALLADAAATEAQQKALLADAAATEAQQKALLADAAAESANKSTRDAEQAAIDAFEISENPTYIGQDHYVYIYNKQTQSYNKTDIYCKGDAFSVKKTYPSVAAMNADFSGTDTRIGDFVLIESGNVQNPDNSKLYVKTALTWEFLTDLSGAIGFTGKTPQFSIGNVTTSDAGTAAVVTVNDDGVDASGNPKYKINFSIPKGGKGDKGDKGDVEYATFYLDHITGCLYMTYDPSFNNVSFSIKNGNLILEINTL